MKDFKVPEALQEAIVGYYSNSLSQKMAEDLIAWLEKSEDNKKHMYELGEVWRITGSLSGKDFDRERALSALQTSLKERDFHRVPGRTIHIQLSRLYKLIATFALLVAIGVLTYLVLSPARFSYSDEGSYFEAVAPKGSKSFIQLSDGTSIWLNADTKIRYQADFGRSSRDIYLEGEAYFIVPKNIELPFKVTTSDICITALGTSFNVKSYNDEDVIETTLEEGLLQIEPLEKPGGLKKSVPITLEPNQNAVFMKETGITNIDKSSDASDHLTTKTPDQDSQRTESDIQPQIPIQINDVSDVKLYTSWKDSRWKFKDEKLSELAPKLERRYDINIIFMSAGLKNYALTATLIEEPLEQILQAISLSTPIKFEVKSKNVYLYEDPELIKRYKNLLNL